MSKESADYDALIKVLEGSSRLALEQNQQTNIKIDKLADSVATLVNISIKSEERHKQYDDRFERIEENQKEQGRKQEHMNEALLLLGERQEGQKKNWAIVGKILLAVTTAAITGLLLFRLGVQ